HSAPCSSSPSVSCAVSVAPFLLQSHPPPLPLPPFPTRRSSDLAIAAAVEIRQLPPQRLAFRDDIDERGSMFALQPFEQRQAQTRSEEHTSELQSRVDLVCRLLLEKKKRRVCTTDVDTTNIHV